MEKRTLHSPDLTARNIERIADLFPQVITESRDAEGNVTLAVDFDLAEAGNFDLVTALGELDRLHGARANVEADDTSRFSEHGRADVPGAVPKKKAHA